MGNNSDYELNVLRRTLVERLTRQTILDFLQGSEENCETFSWFYNDLNALRLYINGGKISKLGTYKRSLEVLSELYHTYRDDLKDGTPLKTTSGTRGDLYLRMMITLIFDACGAYSIMGEGSGGECGWADCDGRGSRKCEYFTSGGSL